MLIGAGRLATNLGHALKDAGHEVTCVYSRTLESAQVLADALGTQCTNQLHAVPKEADIFIVALKDSVLSNLLPQVVQGREGQLFVHTAGSMPMSLFCGSAQHYGVFYPMQTFSKERLVDFREISLFIEASDDESLHLLQLLAASLTSHVYLLNSEDRKHLHLAAVFACNFVNHCYALSAEVLERKGLPFSVMLPLIDETARKVHTLSPREAQTGPAVRYDENVIRMQSQMLIHDPLTQAIYQQLSQSIHQKQKQS